MEPQMTPFHITQADGNITAAAGVADTWSDIWKYQVPPGSGIILQAGDIFSMYMEDGSAEVGSYDCYVKLEVRDASEQEARLVYGPNLYNRSKEFQDRNKTAKLGIAEPVKVYPRQWVVVVVKDNGTIDQTDSYFDLFTSKVAVPLA